MNRLEYMSRLNDLLADISAEDRRDALQYYEDYFDEAGAGNEARVISDLGTPETVAKGIKDGLFMEDTLKEGQFTEYGYDDPEKKRIRYAVAEKNAYGREKDPDDGRQDRTAEPGWEAAFDHLREESAQYEDPFREYERSVEDDWKNRYEEERRYEEQRRRDMEMRYEEEQRLKKEEHPEQKRHSAHRLNPAVWIVIAIFGFPIWFPVLMVGIGLAFGLILAAAGIVFGFGIGAVVCLGGGLFGIAAGIIRLFSSPLAGIIAFGGSLAVTGFGLLLLAASAAIITKVLPAFARGLNSLFRRTSKRRRAYV